MGRDSPKLMMLSCRAPPHRAHFYRVQSQHPLSHLARRSVLWTWMRVKIDCDYNDHGNVFGRPGIRPDTLTGQVDRSGNHGFEICLPAQYGDHGRSSRRSQRHGSLRCVSCSLHIGTRSGQMSLSEDKRKLIETAHIPRIYSFPQSLQYSRLPLP